MSSCTTTNELDELVRSHSGALVCKSSSIEPRDGNPLPRLCHFSSPYNGSINSMGVPNLGYKFYFNYGQQITKPYIQSIIPFSVNELKTMLVDIEHNTTKSPTIVELNMSCPNIVNKSIVAYDYEQFDRYMDVVRHLNLQQVRIGIKLPPYFDEIGFTGVFGVIEKYSKYINFVTTINSLVNGLLVDPLTEKTLIRPKDGFGGIGGVYCKPTALANINRFYNKLGNRLTIIGCGGISSGSDAFEHILCGASIVQVGTTLLNESPKCFTRLSRELEDIMEKKGYKHISDFKGKLRVA